MAIGPRLDLRQSQSLVMTPQLRQAIKLLQFSNFEVANFVEEELERNPLLERDERAEPAADRPAPDQIEPIAARSDLTGFEDAPAPADTADSARSGQLASAQAEPLDMAHAETYDPGGASDGVATGRGHGGDFADDDRGVDDYAAGARSLREHLGEQLSLSLPDRVERIIGAHLIALLDPSGRLLVPAEAIAPALGIAARASGRFFGTSCPTRRCFSITSAPASR